MRPRAFRWAASSAAILALLVVPAGVEAFSSSGGTESTTVSVPGPGDGSATTSDLPPAATQGTIDAQPGPTDDLAQFDDLTLSVVDSFPKLGKLPQPLLRRVTCAFLSQALATNGLNGDWTRKTPVQETVYNTNAYAATLVICLQMVAALEASAPGPTASAASTGCKMVEESMVMRFSRVGHRYRVQTIGTTSEPKRRAPLAISCRTRGKGLRLGVKPRARHTRLRSAAGPDLGLGFYNRGTGALHVRTSFTVR